MAQALIAGLCGRDRSRPVPTSAIFVSDIFPQKLKKLSAQFKISPLSNRDLAQKCSVIILAIKPQDLSKVLSEIAPEVKNSLIISIAAGVDCPTISKYLKKSKLVRAMPNNPALIGEGITALYSPSSLSKTEKKLAEKIFEGSGEILWVNKESDLDIVTGLSGSGPAYVYRFVEALAQAGKKLGLSETLAYRLALKTTLGASLTLEKTKKLPAELIPLVTSKKGTTLAGLKILDQKNFNSLIALTVAAATKRAKEMREEFKGK